MATGRIGTTPALGFRWSIEPAGGTTSLSGLDNNSVGLSYTPGNERVYRNGVLLSRVNDYTATSGNSITLNDATVAGDIIEVFSQDLTQLADTIARSTLTAKGQVLTATAASTPAVLTVGANNTVLTADSTTATGLKWAAAGGLVELATGTLSGSVVNLSSISGSYKNLQLIIRNFRPATDGAALAIRLNADTATRYTGSDTSGTFAFNVGTGLGASGATDNGASNSLLTINFFDYANTTTWKMFNMIGISNNSTTATSAQFFRSNGFYNQTGAITAINLFCDTGNFTSGDYILYGVQ